MSEMKDYLRKLAANPNGTRHGNIAHSAVNRGYVQEHKSRHAITYTINDAGREFAGLIEQEQTDGEVQTNGQEDGGQGQRQDHEVDAGSGQAPVLTPDDIVVEDAPKPEKPKKAKKRK